MEKKRNRTKNTKRTDSERFKEEEPHLSGAYIRSLVKQLTASKPKQEDETSCTLSPSSSAANLDSPEPKQVKKQVRRRQHTSKPYQERLLNMAEARREIVTALKYHRAAMRQAQAEASQRAFQDNPVACPSASFGYPTFGLPSSPLSPWIPTLETSDLPINLPSETLGLNLNFHDLCSAEFGFFVNNSSIGVNNSFGIPSFSPSSSSLAHDNTIEVAPTPSRPTNVPAGASSPPITSPMLISSNSISSNVGGPNLHQALDDEEMAEIRSLGLQHELEWNDTMNLVNSAWWFRFLSNLQVKDEGPSQGRTGGLFDEFMEIPTCLRDRVENLEANPMASSDDYEDFLQDNSFEW